MPVPIEQRHCSRIRTSKTVHRDQRVFVYSNRLEEEVTGLRKKKGKRHCRNLLEMRVGDTYPPLNNEMMVIGGNKLH